jgi:hypothetical protein
MTNGIYASEEQMQSADPDPIGDLLPAEPKL